MNETLKTSAKFQLISNQYQIFENRLKITRRELFRKNEVEIPIDEISNSITEITEYSRGAALWSGLFFLFSLIIAIVPDKDGTSIGLALFGAFTGLPGLIVFYYKYRKWICLNNKSSSVYFLKSGGDSEQILLFIKSLHEQQIIAIKRRISKMCFNYEKVLGILSFYEDMNVLTFSESELMLEFSKQQYEILKIEIEMNHNSKED